VPGDLGVPAACGGVVPERGEVGELGLELRDEFGGSEALEAAHQRLLLTLNRARRASADVATSRKRLELRISELERQADETKAPGGEAMHTSRVGAAGQDQTTRDVAEQLAGLCRQYAGMQAEEQRVHPANRRLFAEVNAFRTSKDAIKAAYAGTKEAAKAVSAAATGEHLAQDGATGDGTEAR